jgi:lysophospholipase L1-like esterase
MPPSKKQRSGEYAVTKQCVAMLGDSLTYRFDRLHTVADCTMHNFGMDGAVVDDVLAGIDRVLAVRPDKMFLQIGINDLLGMYCLWSDAEPNLQAAFEGIARRHAAICLTLRRKAPGGALHVCSLLPVACGIDPRGRVNAAVRMLNGMYEKTAGDTGAVFINLYDTMADAAGGLGADYDLDGVHLRPAAYAVWLESLLPFLRPTRPAGAAITEG